VNAWAGFDSSMGQANIKKKEGDFMKKEFEDDKIKNPLPPVKREVHLLLREYCLRKTRETGHLITQGEVIEKAILDFINNKKN